MIGEKAQAVPGDVDRTEEAKKEVGVQRSDCLHSNSSKEKARKQEWQWDEVWRLRRSKVFLTMVVPNCGDDVLSSCHKYTATDRQRELGKSDTASKSG